MKNNIMAIAPNYRIKENYIEPSTDKVYDIMGREVKTLMDQAQKKGIYTIDWNGQSEYGEFVSTGVYFLQFTSNDYIDKKKMIFLR